MRALVQRVTAASVSVDGALVSEIGRGMCVLVGISRHDTPADAEWLARKLLNLRIFTSSTDDKKWELNVVQEGLDILCVSQFTLYCVLKGNKPDFHQAMASEKSADFFNEFVDRLRTGYQSERVKTGQFGAFMNVKIQNDGPVTVSIESPAQQPKKGDTRNCATKPTSVSVDSPES